MTVLRLRVLTWWTILRISLEERLVYRSDFALATLMRFVPVITHIFLWFAVFQSVKGNRIAGYAVNDFVAYYLLTMISRAFSSMPGLASGIALQIRTGEIKKFLIQPIDFMEFLLLTRVAHKMVYYLVALAPFTLVFLLCRGYFSGIPDAEIWCAYTASLILSFLMGFFLEATIGMIGFWFLEVGSLLFVYMLFNYFLSGHMFPLDLLPEPWLGCVRSLPLQYLAYFPAQVFLGKVSGAALAQGLLTQLVWVIGLALLSRALFYQGLKRYSAFGG